MHRLILFDAGAALSADGWRLRPQEVLDLSSSAEMLDRCRRRLVEVEELAEAQLAEARAQGFAEGFADGHAAGRQEASAQLSDFLAQLSREQACSQAAVGRLAMDVVRRLLGDIDAARSLELFVIRRFEDLLDERPLALRAPIGCGPAIERRLKGRGVSLRVVEDPALAADECAFELASGCAHASVRLQLDALEVMIGVVEADLARGGRHVA